MVNVSEQRAQPLDQFDRFVYGTVAEWTIAPALKADEPQGSEGSNPSRSAV